MKNIKAICLDLDDTLWDVGPVIVRAEIVLYEWLGRHYPRVTELFSPDDIRGVRATAGQEHPEKLHDLSWLRRETYQRLARRAGYPPEMADAAFEVFQTARNQVSLFDDVLPVLETLVHRRPLLALTNGNADLEVIGLAHFFHYSFTAAELGVAKPDPAVFREVAYRSGMAAGDIVYVGDDPRMDVVAARRAGMRAIWVNRRGVDWPDDVGEPGHEVRDLRGLLELLAS